MTFTPEQREEYRRHKERLGYDKRSRAVGIIMDNFRAVFPAARPDSRPRDGIVTCGNPISYDDVKVRIDVNGHEYHDSKHCNSWACPVCGPKRARARASEIEQALIGANKLGLSCYFITFTVPHKRRHSTAHVLKVLDECYQKTRHDKGIRKLLKGAGFVGMVKAKDYTLTDNGTHAHLHCVWFFDGVDDGAGFAAELGDALRAKWDRLVYLETGRHIHKRYGFDLEFIELGKPGEPDAERIAHYAAKSISVYLSDDDKGKSKTPFDLLSASASDDDKARYLDWYKGQKGKRHILFSPGLKAFLGVKSDKPAPADNAAIAYIGAENAYMLKNVEVKHEFEDRAAASVEGALEWLEDKARRRRDALLAQFPPVDIAAHVWTVPHMDLVRELDAAPRSSWAPILSYYKDIQEVVFPARVEYWEGFRAIDGRAVLWELEREFGRSDEGKAKCQAVIDAKIAERRQVKERLSRRIAELSPPSRSLPPLYTPRPYRLLSTREERSEWLRCHRAEYGAKASARLRAYMSDFDARRAYRSEMLSIERGEVFADELFPPEPSPPSPRRVSGMGAALAGIVPGIG